MTVGEIRVRGGASAEELAVVLAVVRGRDVREPDPDPYLRWRAARRHALRPGAAASRPD